MVASPLIEFVTIHILFLNLGELYYGESNQHVYVTMCNTLWFCSFQLKIRFAGKLLKFNK